ncbi:MAG: P-loop ATPase, Sll1717 family [Actinomycetota bacterium]
MAANDFLRNLGFDDDPFASTNAETEKRLAEYFVPPPYFASVMGDPENPQSHIVFAPRGGGKTAQRRMIEDEAATSGTFLCITYDRFDLDPAAGLEQVSLQYHLTNVCRLMLVGVLVTLDAFPDLVGLLTEHQKSVLKFQIERFLGSLSSQEFETATRTLKNLGDKVKDFWDTYGGPITPLINALTRKLGLEDVASPGGVASSVVKDEPLAYHLKQLAEIVQQIGYSSTYVLVDRVDEVPVAAKDASSTFRLISPLLLDLPTLETPGIAFNFFMWDQIADLYAENGGRPDRITVSKLKWAVAELQEMLRQRLNVYSSGGVASMNEVLCEPELDVHQLVAYLAAGSPRDMIRFAQRMVAEETRTAQTSPCLSNASIWGGAAVFARERANELFGTKYIAELAKVGKPTFTINELANDIFKVNQQSARSKVQNWTNTGLVAKIGELANPGKKPLHLYGVADVRLALAMLPAPEAEFVLGNYAFACRWCDFVCISDKPTIRCLKCLAEFDPKRSLSLLEVCSNEPWRYIRQSRRRRDNGAR